MKPLSLLIALFLCLVPAFAHAATDAEITQKLTGTWVGMQKGFEGTLEYHADGVCVSHLKPVDFFIKLIANPYDFEGTWTIKDGVLYSTVNKSNTKAIKIGTVYKNEILKLTKSTFVTRNEKGWTSEFKRKS